MKFKYPIYLVFKKNINHYGFGLKNPRQKNPESIHLQIDDDVLIIFRFIFQEFDLENIRSSVVNYKNRISTEMLGIDIYDDIAIIGDELYRFDVVEEHGYRTIDETNKWPRIKMKKEDLLGFIDLWLELTNKGVEEIYIGRNKNKLALWSEDKSYEAEFSLVYSEDEI